ncbi:MAG: hypothetical protein M3141_07245 [Actinomycetota bacterium]|nr:hypothetical protein [Actinomycetota bacterium]
MESSLPVFILADIPAAPVFGLMTAGIVIAIAGHIVRERRAVALGIAVLFVATALMIVGGLAAYRGGDEDPRKPKSPSTPGF